MIYGLVPVGGVGSRLGLPFHKELLPLKGYDKYYPVCKLTVDNMLQAGAEKIIFIHGKEYKNEIKNIFNSDTYIHLNNYSSRQSEVFSVVYKSLMFSNNDVMYYGLPDSYYTKNLFLEMKEKQGLVCGVFNTDNDSYVGRINYSTKKFIKNKKMNDNSNFCWGVLKFDFDILKKFNIFIDQNLNSEAEEMINCVDFSLVFGEAYYDLGTWQSLNNYWNL